MDKYGSVTVGYGSPFERKIPVESFLRVQWNDHRLCSVSKIGDGSYILAVENPASSGRNTENTMWLSPESFTGLLVAAMFHLQASGVNFDELLQEFTKGKDILYDFSDNLKPVNKNEP